jgi:hypothetical protein
MFGVTADALMSVNGEEEEQEKGKEQLRCCC